MKAARALAHANIALAKYWGKADERRNLAAVPSLSLTLQELSTTTTVVFDAALTDDQVVLDGEEARDRPRDRVVKMLDRVRAQAGLAERARVESTNDFPTAAGLASSASGFAALALAASKAAGIDPSLEAVGALAREASVSAARSVYGGYVSLAASAERAERVVAAEVFPLVMIVAVTVAGPKAVSSTQGMLHTARSSPYYAAWVADAPRLYEQARRAVIERDLDKLGTAMEQSALMMHASMLAASPALVYFAPQSLSVMARVRDLRAAGIGAYFTMDAGPHVKVVAEPASANDIAEALAAVPGVARTLRCTGGPDAQLVEVPEAGSAGSGP